MRVFSSSLLAIGMLLFVPSLRGQAVDTTDDLCDVMSQKTVASRFGVPVFNCIVTGNVAANKDLWASSIYIFAGYQRIFTIKVQQSDRPLSLEQLRISLQDKDPTGEFVNGVGLVAYAREERLHGRLTLRGYFLGKTANPAPVLIDAQVDNFFEENGRPASDMKQIVIDIAKEVIAKLSK